MRQNQISISKDEGGVLVAPCTRELSQLADQLSGWLSARIGLDQPIQVTNLQYPRGAGGSHETILFDAEWSDKDGELCRRGMVVRIKPTSYRVFQGDFFSEQYQLLQLMDSSGCVKVPKPLYFEADPSLLGAPFFVMEKVIGRVAVTVPPYAQEGWLFDATPAQRRKLWDDSVRQLASIQTIPVEKAAFLKSAKGPTKGFAQEWARWTDYVSWLEETSGPIPFVRQAHAALQERWPDHRPEGIVWGDSRLGNMIVDESFRVAAVVDWEHPSLGGALHDLGWWLTTEWLQTKGRGLPPLEGMGAREETIALWEEVSGKSARDIEWYETYAAFKMMCLGIRMSRLGSVVTGGRDWTQSPTVTVLVTALGIDPPEAIAPNRN